MPIEKVEIFDMNGRTVGALHATPANNGTATINVSSLPAGLYLVKAGNYTGKFVKK